MNETVFHTFAVEMANPEERTVSGLAAPYNETIQHNGRSVRFSKGMFGNEPLANGVHLQYGHDGEPIGRVIEATETDNGLLVKARLTTTSKANDVYTMLKDGTLNKFSVGFVPRASEMDGDTTVWTSVDLHEISVVPRPAFNSAAVAEVHSADTTKEMEIDESTMSEEITNEVAELREAYSDLSRKVTLLGTVEAPAPKQSFTNGGELLKALAAGDDAAKQEFTYTGSTLATNVEPHPAWVNRPLQLVNDNRYVLPLFNQQELPEFGSVVEFPYTSAINGTVGVQANEGDALNAISLNVSMGTASVKTFAATSSLSRQAIDRSDVAFLTSTLDLQAREYALKTDDAVRQALIAASGVQAGTALTVDSAANWVGLVEDSAGLIWDNGLGLTAEILIVSPAVIKRLVTLSDTTGRPVFKLNGDGMNTIGSASVTGLGGFRGMISGMPVYVDRKLTGNTVYVASSQAITSYWSQGAPFRITLPNVLSLTQDFSLWGYGAVAVPYPLGIVKVDTTTA